MPTDTSTLWTNLPPTLQDVKARPLLVLRLAVPSPVNVGETRTGVRRVATVQSGTFDGAIEGLCGRVHPGGLDWICETSDGTTHLDARILLETRDGDKIMMSYRGIRHGPPGVLRRLAEKEPVDPAEYYFRTAPAFETSSANFDWLNRVIAVGCGQRLADGVLYSVFEIL